jgi:hypothetical protein
MQIRNRVNVPLHAEGTVPIKRPFPFRGGMFGQPSLPLGRTGPFGTRFALPFEDWSNDTSSALPDDQYQMPSGYPVRFVQPKATIAPGLDIAPGLGTFSPAGVGLVVGLLGLVYLLTIADVRR